MTSVRNGADHLHVTAKAYGAPLTAIPVFLVRDFHHKAIVVGDGSGIDTPRDLEGRRVGVNRGFTVTTGVWARAILVDEYGVDLGKVTWARSDDEHVPGWRLPDNVEDLRGGDTLEERLADGSLCAAVGLAKADGCHGLIKDPVAAGLAAFRARGLYPINHTVVVRDDVLAAQPGLAEQLFKGFAASKRRYVDDLRAGRIAEPTAIDKVHSAVMETLGDPLPYGIAPNISTLEGLMGHAVAQGIIDEALPIENLFAAETLDLVG